MPREEFSQAEPFTIRGHWWRPGGSYKPSGHLEYREKRIELHLLGAFDDAVGATPLDRVPEPSEIAVIHGESTKGTLITLLGSFYKSWQPGGNFLDRGPVPITSSTLLTHRVLIGTHLPSPSEQCFTACRIRLPNLETWLADNPFRVEFSPDQSGLTVRYERPQPRVFDLGQSIGTVRIACSFRPPAAPSNDSLIEHRAYVDIEPPEPRALNWFVRTIGQIERLFSLLFGQMVQTTRVRLTAPLLTEDGADAVLFYGPQRHVDQRPLHRADFVFRHPDVAEWFAGALISWLTESEPIRHALNLYFSTIREPAPFIESRFLPLVQAIEVYARALAPGRIVPKAEYKKIRRELVNAIPDGISEELREAIEGSLAYANEPRLKQRFDALLNGLESETVQLFCRNRTDFVRAVVDTRNFFTHYSQRYEVLQDRELHWATQKLRVMLDVLLLKRLGIPENVIQTSFRTNHRLAAERAAWAIVSETGSPLHEEMRGDDDDV